MAKIIIKHTEKKIVAYVSEKIDIFEWASKINSMKFELQERLVKETGVYFKLPNPIQYAFNHLKKKVKHARLENWDIIIVFKIPFRKIRKYKERDLEGDVFKWLDEGVERWKGEVFHIVQKLKEVL